jgi:hypothetical protein
MKIYRFLSLFISSFRSQKVSGNEVWQTEPVEALPLMVKSLVHISANDAFGSSPDLKLPHRKH